MKPKSLKRRLMSFIILCWAVPIIVLFSFSTLSYRRDIFRETDQIMEERLKSDASYISIRLEDAINICENPSYKRIWEQLWKKNVSGELDRTHYLANINTSLKGEFNLDERFRLYAFYEPENQQESPVCYASRAGVNQEEYMKIAQEKVNQWIENGSNYIHIEVIDGHIYMMRNLYTTMGYKYFGTLVVELSKSKLLADVSKEQKDNLVICINDIEKTINAPSVIQNVNQEELLKKLFDDYDGRANKTLQKEENSEYNGYIYQQKFDNYHLGLAYIAERRTIYSSLYELYDMIIILGLLFLPLIAYVAYFLRKQIQEPINRLIVAAQKMEKGDIGVKVDGESMPNAEFDYLRETFDNMAMQVGELFDYIYDEKLARKDAQILALQAQINPHFLNNTLEMMNWQARMNGDMVVSKMIESLGTVLDYRINRANVKEIYLVEELRCTDAYFYIMSMRFGQRLQVEKEVEEDLFYIMVPPLILQPLVENAIVHGVEHSQSGSIQVQVYRENEQVYLKVINTGKRWTKKENEQIQAILNGDTDNLPKGKGKHTSIGIRNVNERIKLVYGEEYGLSIYQEEDGHTVSSIVLPYQREEQESKKEERHQKERQKVETELRNIHQSKKEN